MPTITEEAPTTLTPSNSNHNFTLSPSSTPSPTCIQKLGKKRFLFFLCFLFPVCKIKNPNRYLFVIEDENDSNDISSTLLRHRKIQKTDVDDIDDYVQIPPIIQEKPYHINKDSSKSASELQSTTNETGHPIIYSMFFKT